MDKEYLLETERLRVRKFIPEDAESLYENHLDDQVARWFPNECYADIKEARGAIDFYADCVNKKRLPYVLAVELKESGELIGDTGVNEVKDQPCEVEVGYVIFKSYRNRGYATELLTAISRLLSDTFSTEYLYGRVLCGNLASAKVLEKCGYTLLREEMGAEDDPYGNGVLVYRLTI